MRSLLVRAFSLLSLFVLPSLSAYASSISAGTYSLTGTTVHGTALSGTLTLDSNGLATSANITFEDASYGDPLFSVISSTGTSGNNPVSNFAYLQTGSNSGQLVLYYASVLNADGSISLCESGSGCSQASYLHMYSPDRQANLVGGDLQADSSSAVAPTPEPASWMLVATGMLMMCSVPLMRRRPDLQTATA